MRASLDGCRASIIRLPGSRYNPSQNPRGGCFVRKARIRRSSPIMTDLTAIGLLLLLGWFWLDSLRAREIALGICRAACEQRDLQFLDQAVALRRLGLRWRSEGLRLRRVYRFDFSEEGVGRRQGYLVLRGMALEDLSFGLPDTPTDA
jgi:hypothetical protein